MNFYRKCNKCLLLHFGGAPWANCLAFAGQIWPAGRWLKTPDLKDMDAPWQLLHPSTPSIIEWLDHMLGKLWHLCCVVFDLLSGAAGGTGAFGIWSEDPEAPVGQLDIRSDRSEKELTAPTMRPMRLMAASQIPWFQLLFPAMRRCGVFCGLNKCRSEGFVTL